MRRKGINRTFKIGKGTQKFVVFIVVAISGIVVALMYQNNILSSIEWTGVVALLVIFYERYGKKYLKELYNEKDRNK